MPFAGVPGVETSTTSSSYDGMQSRVSLTAVLSIARIKATLADPSVYLVATGSFSAGLLGSLNSFKCAFGAGSAMPSGRACRTSNSLRMG